MTAQQAGVTSSGESDPGKLRTLRRIERDLADSDPGLDALYQGFARRSRGLDLRWLEKADRKRFRIFSRRHERSLGERIKDWTAENWNGS